MATDDKTVVVLISSDDDLEATQPDAKRRKGTVDEKKTAGAAEAAEKRSAPPSGGVRAATPEEEESRGKVGSLKTRRRLIKRKRQRMAKRKMNNQNQINSAPQHEISEEEHVDKLKDVETTKVIGVGESVRSMVVIGISSSSEEDEQTAELSSNRVDQGMLLVQPIVNKVKKEKHPDTVKAIKTEGKQLDAGQSIEVLKLKGTKLVEKSKNIVLQKLLRRPRYFDLLERNREMCYHCGEEGHKTVSCTSKRPTKPCFVCAGFGHNGMSCKQGQECFNCKGLGHIAKKCPNKIEENLLTSNICLRCGDSGHDMWTCNSDYSHDDLKEIQCHVCKKFGHLCCVNYPDLGSRQISCCNCGQSGHVGSECAKVDEKPRGSRSSISCRKSREKGHSASKCEKHAKAEKAQRISKEERDSLGSKSAPPNLKKAKEKIKTPYEERPSASAFQPRWRNDQNMDGHRTLCFRASGSNVWRTPPTSAKINGEMSVSSSRNLWSPGKSFQMFNHPAIPGSQAFQRAKNNPETFALSACGNFMSPQNPNYMFDHFATPGSQAYQPARYIQGTSTLPASGNSFIPQNPFQIFSSPPFPGSQPYLPTKNNQETSTLPASRNFLIPQNPVQMYNQRTYTLPTSGHSFIPQNPPQMFSSPPFPGSQAYRHIINSQEISTLPASRNFPIPQNPVQMSNHSSSPSSQAYRARFDPPWSGNFSFGHTR